MSFPEGLSDILNFLQLPLFSIFGVPITPLAITIFVFTLIIVFFFSRMIRHTIRERIFTKFDLEEKTGIVLNRIIHYLVMLSGVAVAFHFITPSSDVLQSIRSLLTVPIYTINQTGVTLLHLGAFLFIFILFILLSQFARKVLVRNLTAYLKLDSGASYTMSQIMHYIFMVIGAIVAFQFIGIDFSGLAVVFGFLSVGIGFGLQNITSNFISGLILLFERPIEVGDRVTVGDTIGDVQEIKIRATRIQSMDNISIIVPNSEFVSSNVINWSHGDPKIRVNVRVGVSYDSDLDLVIRSLKSIAEADEEVLKSPVPDVLLENFGASSWDMNLRVWIADPKRAPNTKSRLNCAIVRKFREENIEIPFPQRDLHLRSPLPLPLQNANPNGKSS